MLRPLKGGGLLVTGLHLFKDLRFMFRASDEGARAYLRQLMSAKALDNDNKLIPTFWQKNVLDLKIRTMSQAGPEKSCTLRPAAYMVQEQSRPPLLTGTWYGIREYDPYIIPIQ